MSAVTPELIAYIAGVIDVRSRIKIQRFGETDLPLVAVSTPDARLARFLCSATGMNPVLVRRDYKRVGCHDHCDRRHLHVKSQTSRWTVSGAKATIVLAATRPYLHIQTRDADAALACGLSATHKPATPTKMAALGWPLPEWRAAA
jgi:hypothetical protein